MFTDFALNQDLLTYSMMIAIGLLVVILFVRTFLANLLFLWLRFTYAVPLIGRFDRLLKSDGKIEGKRWSSAERILCSDYYQFVPSQVNLNDWDNATAYLKKAQELGREEFSIWGWLGVLMLLVVESASFGILLTDYVSDKLSVNDKLMIGYSLATVLAIVLLVITHAAGRELHRNVLIKTARQWFLSRPEVERNHSLRPFPDVYLDNNQLDDHQPIYIQMVSRFRASDGTFQPGYTLSVLAFLLISGVAVSAYQMRTALYHKQMTESAISAKAAENAPPPNDDIKALLGENTLAISEEDKAILAHDQRYAADRAFWMLGGLFAAMQLFGVLIGYQYGFAGQESKFANRVRAGFSNKANFINYHQRQFDFVANIAQVKLERLQHALRQHANGDFDSRLEERTFRAYVLEKLKEQDPEYQQITIRNEPITLKVVKPLTGE